MREGPENHVSSDEHRITFLSRMNSSISCLGCFYAKNWIEILSLFCSDGFSYQFHVSVIRTMLGWGQLYDISSD